MTETGWIVPGAFIGNQISQFRWTDTPARDSIRASRVATRTGYIYTIEEGHHRGDVITVERGIITIYEKARAAE